MPTFQDAHLKLKRAKHHIFLLVDRIKLLGESDVAVVQISPERGNEVIKHDITDKGGLADIALIAGDAFHNLKCALDYAWIESIKKLAPAAVSKFSKFPVYPTRDGLAAALRGKGIEEASRDLFKAMLGEIKPYATGDFAIWPIHRLDIRDKHRLLVPTVLYTSICGIETQDETGKVSGDGFTAGTHQEPPWYVPMHPGVHVTNKGKVAFSISFDYGDLSHESIFADSLDIYLQQILRVVETLEALI